MLNLDDKWNSYKPYKPYKPYKTPATNKNVIDLQLYDENILLKLTGINNIRNSFKTLLADASELPLDSHSLTGRTCEVIKELWIASGKVALLSATISKLGTWFWLLNSPEKGSMREFVEQQFLASHIVTSVANEAFEQTMNVGTYVLNNFSLKEIGGSAVIIWGVCDVIKNGSSVIPQTDGGLISFNASAFAGFSKGIAKVIIGSAVIFYL